MGMSDASPVKVFLVVSLISVSSLVSAPLILEAILSLSDKLGYQSLRLREDVQALQERAMNLSDRAEHIITALTVAGFLSAVYFHVTEIIADAEEATTTHLFVFHIIPSVVINANIFYFFYQAVRKDPGTPSETGDMEGGRRCRLCLGPQPARSHHCVTCDKCVLYMDHHCPFTSNCVGQENYPFFFGWVMWSWIAAIYAVWLCYDPHMYCLSEEGKASSKCPTGHKKAMLFNLSACFCGISTIFFTFVLYLLLNGETARAFLNTEVVDPFAQFRQRGPLFCAQYRLGPISTWWRYILPFSLAGRTPYVSKTTS